MTNENNYRDIVIDHRASSRVQLHELLPLLSQLANRATIRLVSEPVREAAFHQSHRLGDLSKVVVAGRHAASQPGSQ